MHLSRLVIKNYRSIKAIDLGFSKGKNIIVGKNNAGKSNIMKALDLVLGESTPNYKKSENITEADFYTYKAGSDLIIAEDIFIYCELIRDADEELNYEEINKCYGFYKFVKRIDRNSLDADFNEAFDIMADDLERNEKFYLNPKLKNQTPFEDEFKPMHSFAFVFKAKRLEDGDIYKDIRFFYRENKDTDWIMSFTAPIRTELIQSAIIPSFRDPQNQLRINTWTWYGKLVKHLTRNHGKQVELTKAFDGVRAVADDIFKTAKENIQASSINVAFPGSELSFQFNNDIKTEIYKNCSIYIDDGVKSSLFDKGSGIQSAAIIGLFGYYVREVNTISSALLCLEEPELYLHPHARRVISDRLDSFLDNNKNQVILTTHSPEFIRTTDGALNIVLVRKTTNGTTATQINIGSNKSLLLDNNHNEVFFADKVIVCEGYDDYVLKWVAKEKFQETIDAQNVTIISVGGKDRIRTFVGMLLKLNIDCFVFADFDYFLRDNTDDADKYKEEKDGRIKSYRHMSIVDLPTSFFKQNCILGEDASIIDTVIQIRAEVKKNKEELFYKAKTVAELEDVNISELTVKLRKKGIGILDTDIEGLSKMPEFLSAKNKLSLDKIFQISAKLTNENKKISEIIATEQIEEFLNVVLA